MDRLRLLDAKRKVILPDPRPETPSQDLMHMTGWMDERAAHTLIAAMIVLLLIAGVAIAWTCLG